MSECFDVVDENDNIIGRATRGECHSNPGLIHRGIHVLVFNKEGEILLQKRSMGKDLYQGKWDSSVSGHVGSGDNYEETSRRELKEELGVELPLKTAFTFFHKGKEESEMNRIFIAESDGPFKPRAGEIDEIRFFAPEEVKRLLGKNPEMFSPNFRAVMGEYFKRFWGHIKHG